MVRLEIVTPDGKYYSEDVELVIVRGVEGDIAFMKSTAPIVTPLGIGKIRVKTELDGIKWGTLNEGYVSNLNDKVTVVTDAFEWSDEIDVARARAAKERAEDRLKRAEKEGLDVKRAKAALYRALNRLDVHDIVN